MDQNTQFIIIVGTVIGVFLWLRHDINQIHGRIDSLETKFDKLSDSVAALRESMAWMRGRTGLMEQPPSQPEQ